MAPWLTPVAWAVFLTAGFFVFLAGRTDIDTSEFSGWALAVVGLAAIGNLATTVALNHVVVNRVRPSVALAESAETTAVASALNYLAPLRAGAIFRSIYFKRMHGLGYGEFAGTVAVSLVGTSIAAGLGLLVGAALGLGRAEQSSVALLTFGVLPLIAGGMLAFASRTRSTRAHSGIPTGRLSSFFNSIAVLASDLTAGWRIAAISCLQVLTVGVGLGAAIAAVGGEIDFAAITIVSSLGVLSLFIALTPGGIGVYELAVALGGTVIGERLTTYLAAALVQRLLGIAVVFLAAGPGWYLLGKRSMQMGGPRAFLRRRERGFKE